MRWFYLTLLVYVLGYFLSAFEAAFFTHFGGTAFLFALGVLPSLLSALAFAWLVKSPDPPEPFVERTSRYFENRPLKDWLIRLALVWVAFPIAYSIFGLCVAPIVVPIYRTMDFLAIPSLGTVTLLQLTRSLFMLAVLLPVFITSKASRLSLALAVGWAFYALTGLSGMVGGDFFPTTIRWAHGVELMMDSIVYVKVATLLLAYPKSNTRDVQSLHA